MEHLNLNTSLSIFILFFCIVGHSFFLTSKIKIDINFAPAMSVSLYIILIYIAGLFNNMLLSTYFLIGSGILFFLFYVVSSIKCKKIDAPYVVLFFIFAIVAIRFNGAELIYHDDFSHWGLSSLDMYLSNGLSTKDSYIALTDYPQGVSVFHYVALKINDIISTKGFSENVIISANNIIYIVLVLPMIMMAYRKSLGLMVAIVLLFYLIAASQYGLTESSLNVDLILGSMFAINIMIWWIYGFSKPIYFIVFLPVLTLIKTSGMFFIISFIIIMSVYLIYKKSLKHIGGVLFFLILSLMLHSTWVNHVKSIDSSPLFSVNSINVKSIKDVIYNPTLENSNIINNFKVKVFIPAVNNTLPIYFLITFLISIFILISVKKRIRKKTACLFISLFACLLFYMTGLLCLYLFSFTYEEAKVLASINRYSYIYMSGWTIVNIGILLHQPSFYKIEDQSKSIILIILCTYIFSFSIYSREHIGFKMLKYKVNILDVSRLKEKYNKQLSGYNRIYYINNGREPSSCSVMRYISVPSRVNYTFNRGSNGVKGDDYSFLKSCNISSDKDNNLPFARTVSPSVWGEELASKYDYVLLNRLHYSFKDQFKELFDNYDSIKNRTLFEVIKTNNGNFKTLKKVN